RALLDSGRRSMSGGELDATRGASHVAGQPARLDRGHLDDAHVAVAKDGIEGMTHSDAVNLRARLDQERVTGAELIAAEKASHATQRREGRVDAFCDNPGRAADRPPVQGRMPRRPEGVSVAVAAEGGGLSHSLMVRRVYQP